MTDNTLGMNIERVSGFERGSEDAREAAREIAASSTATDVFDLLERLEFHKGSEWRELFAGQTLKNGEKFPEVHPLQMRDFNRIVATYPSRDRSFD